MSALARLKQRSLSRATTSPSAERPSAQQTAAQTKTPDPPEAGDEDVEEIIPSTRTCVPVGGGPRGPPPDPAAAMKTVKAWKWICGGCDRECIPIRTESRCLCGHRLKEHGKGDVPSAYSCKNARCRCKEFQYIVAEGSWILRCRCKHKHIEHDPVTKECTKPRCDCSCFDSPWVCNCDHAWSEHKQVLVETKVHTLESMMAAAVVGELEALDVVPDVNRWDKIERGR